MRSRWLNVLLLVAMVLGALPFAARQLPPVAASSDADPALQFTDHPQSPSSDPLDPEKRMQMERVGESELLLQASAASPGPVLYELQDAAGPATYIIQLEAQPVATYAGEFPGLRATSPTVTGASRLDVDSLASQAYRDYLSRERATVLNRMQQVIGRSITVIHAYDVAYNGMAVELTPEEAAEVVQLPGVARVIRNFERFVQTDTTPEFLNAWGIWDGTNTGGLVGTMGEGIVVGIIDTGINMQNRSFAATADDGYTHTNPRGPGNYTGWCDPNHLSYDPDLVCNDKLIGVYSYADSGNNPVDDHSHGSHTAGTAAGNILYDVEYDGYTFSTIAGIAPRANIISYDVCLPAGGCQLSSILAAINDAIGDGVDVLNYSIGGGPDNPWGDPDSEAFLNARAAGVFVATSAGNSGPGPGTVGSPANSPWMTSVGNTTIGRILANTVDVTGPNPVPAGLQGIGAIRGPEGPAISADIEADIIYSGDVDADNVLGCHPFPAGSFAAGIALIQRGSCTFAVKVDNAYAAGAIAVIIFNASGGPPMSMGGLEGTQIPSVFVTLDDGSTIRDWVQAQADPTARINAGVARVLNPAWADILASGSSRGPNVNGGFIKPDIAAPGTNIFAAYAGSADAFGMMSGTSMASPHVAGAGALLRALHPDWSDAEIQSALMMTSRSGVLKDDAVTPADPFDVGAGRLDLTSAARVGLVLDETIANYWAADPSAGGDPMTLNLASLANQNCAESCSWTRTFRSVLTQPVTYNVTAVGPAGMEITVEPATFTIAGGGTQTLVITVDGDLSVLTPGDWAFAQLLLEDAAGPTVIDTLLDENFTATTFPPTGWTSHNLQGDGSATWIRDTAQSHSAPASARRLYGGSADGNQDDWLVTPPLAIEDSTWLSYFDRGQWMGDYGYSGVWLSTASCDPADGAFVELLETDDILNNEWRATPVRIELSTYAGETACLAFRYSGDFAHTWWIDDVLVQVVAYDVPVHHLPIAVRPVAATPIIDVTPDELISVQFPEEITTHNLTIANQGGLDLEWEFGNATVTTTVALWDQPVNGSSGIVSDFFIGSNAGAYSASDFVLSEPADISYIFAAGFDNTNSLSAQPAINWAIYADDGGVPAGHPEDGTNMASALWAYTATVDAPGVDITDNDIALDLPAAGETLSLTPGTYWLTVYPSYNVTGAGGARWNWYQAAQVGAQTHLVSPGVFGVANWTALGALGVTFSDTAFRIEAQAVIICEHPDDVPWLAAVPTSGMTAAESSTDVTVSLNSSGMAPDSYEALLCIESNDPERPLVVVPVEMIVEAAAEIEVTPGALSTVQTQNAVREQTLTISNAGMADLEWEIEEDDSGTGLLSTEVLYDQTGNTTTSGALAIYDLDGPAAWAVQAADDFVVPVGETWSVESIFAGGFYAVSVNPPQGVNVFIYADNGGLPGDELYAYPELTPTADVAGDLTLDLPTPATLTEGTYWVSVQPRMDFFGDGRWFWLTESVQMNSEFAWRNPGNGYGTGCTDWGSGSDCGFTNPDLTFRILGERSGACLNLGEITWLSVSPTSGMTLPGESDNVTVTFDATGLDVGAYEGNLCIFSNDPLTPLVVIPVAMEVEVAYHDLDVNIVGNGSVTVDPDEELYAYGDQVTLTAVPAPGWSFAGWSGDATGTDLVITVTIEGDSAITATFTEKEVPVYRIMLPLVRRN